MEKIVVDYVYNNYFSARSKAREDVNTIAQQNGFTPFLINTRTTTEQSINQKGLVNRMVYNFRKLFILISAIWTIKRHTIVLFQYPFAPFGEFFTLFFCRCLKAKKCNLIILVHDLVHYRETQIFDAYEIKILNTASELIVHTPKMQELFRNYGVNQPCQILWLFDYISPENPNTNTTENNTIAFAGALDKSIFLHEMKRMTYKKVKMHLYGNPPKDTRDYPEWMQYIGRFAPENITMLHEDWGLSWDGDGIDGVKGVLGNYLRYIAPHKVSLYIAAGIPVIISKESALAEFIETNKLGITVTSLYDIEDAIKHIHKEDLQEMRKSVAAMSARLRNGEMLGSIIKKL